jgi:multicomponent Na+:H+ antiporter subunit B
MEFTSSLILINIISLAFVLVLYFLAREKDSKLSILWLSLFSILSCVIYLIMDAPDVAMTEAALGVCITTVILLRLVKLSEAAHITNCLVQESIVTKLVGLIISVSFGAALIYAGQDLPSYGSSGTAIQSGVQEYYNAHTYHEIGVPSFVAAILASYRGYDTLGETFVIFIAGLCVVMIMNMRPYSAINSAKAMREPLA